MTGYTVHTGSNDKFRDGWDKIFKTKKSSSQGKQSGKAAGQKKQGKTR